MASSNPSNPPNEPKNVQAPAQAEAKSRWGSLVNLTNQASAAANRIVNNSLTSVGNEMWRLGTAMKYSLMTKETEGSWIEIFDLLVEHFSDVKDKKMDFLIGMALLSTYYRTNHLRTDIIVQQIDFLNNVKYYMKFASGAYGFKLVIGLGKEMSTQKVKDMSKGLASNADSEQVNIRAICDHCGIVPDDILLTKFTSDVVFDPGHFIALDHKSKAIVIAFRGTFHIRDCLTDLNAKYETVHCNVFGDTGYVHSGIYKVAKNKEAKVLPFLKEQKEKHPDYKVVITGHSLGGGTAALFAFQLYQEKLPWDIECYSYAPPCVMSPNLSYLYKNKIMSFVYNDDVVPRLSLGSATGLKNAALQMAGQNESVLKNLFLLVNAGNTFGTDASNQVKKVLNHKEIDRSAVTMDSEVEKLVPPGRCYHIYEKFFPEEAKGKVIPKRLVMEESKPEFFTEIVVSNSMFLNHMPLAYEGAFEKVIHTVVTFPVKEAHPEVKPPEVIPVSAEALASPVAELISFEEDKPKDEMKCETQVASQQTEQGVTTPQNL